MKRLITATTLALAVATMGIMPTAATAAQTTMAMPDPDGSAQSEAPPDDPGTDDSTAQGTDDSSGIDDPSGTDDSTAADDSSGTDDSTATDDSSGTADPTEGTDVEGTDADGAEETPTETPDAPPLRASLGLSSSEVTVEDISNPEVGLGFYLEGVLAGDTVSWGEGDGTTATVETDGTFTGIYWTGQEVSPGDTVTVTVSVQRGDQNETYSATAAVIAGETEPTGDVSVEVKPKTQPLSSYLKGGVSVVVSNCPADVVADVTIMTRSDSHTAVFQDEQETGDEGFALFSYVPDASKTKPSSLVGEYVVSAGCGDAGAEATYTVTADGDEQLEPQLWVQPETISGADFVNSDKGVLLTVQDCVSESVRFRVWGTSPRKLLYDRTVDNDSSGLVSAQVYGLENNPATYVGTYDVVANCGGTEIDGAFTVTGKGGGGGGDVGDADDAAGSMPRTGAELTGLGAGAVLILAGAAAVILARRRGRLKQ